VRCLSALLALLIALPVLPATAAPAELNIVIVEGEGATNNIRQRTAREPIVQVEDENHKPVAGAVVVFTLPTHGAGGAFANGAHTLTTVTNDQGQAVARGFQANGAKGSYQMRVNASSNGQTATANINMVNAAAAAGAGAGAATGISGKLIAVIVVVGAAAAGGAIAAVKAGGGGNNGNIGAGATTATTITPGAGTVGPPR
jgi:hypothetical protein